MSFQQIGAVAGRVAAKLEPRPLVHSNGRFDTQAIAARVNDLWAARQEFLAQYEGNPTLRYWREVTWDGIVERVWREASGAQHAWLLENVKPVYTPAEREEYTNLLAQQSRLPIDGTNKFREMSSAKMAISDAARKRAFDSAMPSVHRTRESALADVRMPGDEMAQAAE